MSNPCPTVDEASAYVMRHMLHGEPRVVSAAQTADLYGMQAHSYFARVVVEFEDENGETTRAKWEVWHELDDSGEAYLYGEW